MPKRLRSRPFLLSPALLSMVLAASALHTGPAAAQAPPPAPPAPAPFAADAYPREATPVQRLVRGRGVDVFPLRKTRLAGGDDAVADRLIVAFRSPLAETDLSDAHAGARSRAGVAGRPVGQIGPATYLVDVSGATSLEAAADAYRADPRVAGAGVDRLMRAAETPNDPQFSQQWNMSKIQLPAASNRTHGGQERLVAVLDTGIDESHPDLAGRVSARADFTGSASGTADVVGHGAHVAGKAPLTSAGPPLPRPEAAR